MVDAFVIIGTSGMCVIIWAFALDRVIETWRGIREMMEELNGSTQEAGRRPGAPSDQSLQSGRFSESP